jgi:hypothetical protein
MWIGIVLIPVRIRIGIKIEIRIQTRIVPQNDAELKHWSMKTRQVKICVKV